MFPRIVDTDGNFGRIPASLFGEEITIACSMADQSASLLASGCIKPGDLKLTMGTGSFVNVNTGDEPHASVSGQFEFLRLRIIVFYNYVFTCLFFTGLYPLVAWRLASEIVYVIEGSSNDTGTIIEWAKFSGMLYFSWFECYKIFYCQNVNLFVIIKRNP